MILGAAPIGRVSDELQRLCLASQSVVRLMSIVRIHRSKLKRRVLSSKQNFFRYSVKSSLDDSAELILSQEIVELESINDRLDGDVGQVELRVKI